MCTVKRFGGQSPQKHLREEGVVAWESAGTRRRGEPCTGWGGLERARPCVLHLPEVSLQGERLPVRGVWQAGRGRWGAPAGALSSQTGATPASSTQPSLAPPLQPRSLSAARRPTRERAGSTAPAGWPPPPHSRRATREGPRVHSCGRLPSTMGAGKCQEEPRSLGNGAETFGAPWARQLQARLPEVASAWQQVARSGGVERRGRAQAPSICSGLVT